MITHSYTDPSHLAGSTPRFASIPPHLTQPSLTRTDSSAVFPLLGKQIPRVSPRSSARSSPGLDYSSNPARWGLARPVEQRIRSLQPGARLVRSFLFFNIAGILILYFTPAQLGSPWPCDLLVSTFRDLRSDSTRLLPDGANPSHTMLLAVRPSDNLISPPLSDVPLPPYLVPSRQAPSPAPPPSTASSSLATPSTGTLSLQPGQRDSGATTPDTFMYDTNNPPSVYDPMLSGLEWMEFGALEDLLPAPAAERGWTGERTASPYRNHEMLKMYSDAVEFGLAG